VGERKPESECTGEGKGYADAYVILAERLGVGVDTVYGWVGRARFHSMRFDQADRILAATDQIALWRHDPELAECYEQACKGADRIYPLPLAA